MTLECSYLFDLDSVNPRASRPERRSAGSARLPSALIRASTIAIWRSHTTLAEGTLPWIFGMP